MSDNAVAAAPGVAMGTLHRHQSPLPPPLPPSRQAQDLNDASMNRSISSKTYVKDCHKSGTTAGGGFQSRGGVGEFSSNSGGNGVSGRGDLDTHQNGFYGENGKNGDNFYTAHSSHHFREGGGTGDESDIDYYSSIRGRGHGFSVGLGFYRGNGETGTHPCTSGDVVGVSFYGSDHDHGGGQPGRTIGRGGGGGGGGGGRGRHDRKCCGRKRGKDDVNNRPRFSTSPSFGRHLQR